MYFNISFLRKNICKLIYEVFLRGFSRGDFLTIYEIPLFRALLL